MKVRQPVYPLRLCALHLGDFPGMLLREAASERVALDSSV